ncbi:MAG: lytic murein transglycosylase B [Burkholderiales bacterium]
MRSAVALIALAASLASTGAVPVLRTEYEAFIEEISTKHGYDTGLLRKLFAQVQTRPAIVRAMSAPATARPWHEFQRRIVEPGRIEAGMRFWLANRAVLERASKEFGVPEEFIMATIGIETLYGRNTGNFKVLDALATLAFDYPPRADFFRSELEEYLLLTREAGLDAATMRGSYAGAIGLPQFIPSSYRKYAIDFDGDGRRDLLNSAADAIGSVANYYRSFGWASGASVVVPAQAGDADLGPLLAGGIRPHTKISDLKAKGLILADPVDETLEAAVFSIETETGPQLMIGLNNFYVITRYNRSVNYAMAVYELARGMRALMKTGSAGDAETPLER